MHRMGWFGEGLLVGLNGPCTCKGSGGAAKVCGPIRTPEDVGVHVAQALVKEFVHVFPVALPGLVHVPGGKARVPCAKLCMIACIFVILCAAVHTCCSEDAPTTCAGPRQQSAGTMRQILHDRMYQGHVKHSSACMASWWHFQGLCMSQVAKCGSISHGVQNILHPNKCGS